MHAPITSGVFGNAILIIITRYIMSLMMRSGRKLEAHDTQTILVFLVGTFWCKCRDIFGVFGNLDTLHICAERIAQAP